MTGIFISALGGRPAADKVNELFTVQRLNQGRTEGTDFCSKMSESTGAALLEDRQRMAAHGSRTDGVYLQVRL